MPTPGKLHVSLWLWRGPPGLMHPSFWCPVEGQGFSRKKCSPAGKAKLLETELKQWLPSEAAIKLLEVQGWESPENSLIARFSLEQAGYATATGKRLLTPPYLFRTNNKETFTLAERTYPVYFPYAFAEVDKILINVPSGYSVESIPDVRNIKLPYAQYQNIEKFEGTQLSSTRTLLINGVF